jgi:hypothetical protein
MFSLCIPSFHRRREEEQRTKTQKEREALDAQLQLERQKLERLVFCFVWFTFS